MAPLRFPSAVAVFALASMVSLPANAGRDEMDMEQGLALQSEAGLGFMLEMANAKCKEATKMTTVESTLQAMRDCLNIVKKFPQELTRRKANGVLKDEQFRGALSDLRSFLELADSKIAKVYSKHQSSLDSHHKKLREDLHHAMATLKEAKDMNALGQESAGSVPASFMQVDDRKEKRRHSALGDHSAGRGKHIRHLHRALAHRLAGRGKQRHHLHSSVAHHMAGTGKHTRDQHKSAAHRTAETENNSHVHGSVVHHTAGTRKSTSHVHSSVAHHLAGTQKHASHSHSSSGGHKAGTALLRINETRKSTSHLHSSVAHHMAGTQKHASHSHSSSGGHKAGQRKLSRVWRENVKLHKARSKVHHAQGTSHRHLAGQRHAKAVKAKREAVHHVTKVSQRNMAKSVAKSTKTEVMQKAKDSAARHAARSLADEGRATVVERAATKLAKSEEVAVVEKAASLLAKQEKEAVTDRAAKLLFEENKKAVVDRATNLLMQEAHKRASPVASSLAEESHKNMQDSDASHSVVDTNLPTAGRTASLLSHEAEASRKEHAGNKFAQDVKDEELEETAAALLNEN
eukprot:TRINITY_DN1847_c0_g1_i1.p1 TRINITY_DN1847_c0_g1~~TRINITY_DN1847_c0_g1_i1.p1  ORF type:complete len:607 (-),score=121.90 TRINITY_DN1847_c0_g1_i1:151-1872(-)